MKLYEDIRRAARDDGLSIHEFVAAVPGPSPGCAAGAASAVPPERKRPERTAPKLDAWKPTIEEWLEADRLAPRKQRHTARRVWQRLVEKHGAEVGESTVRRFVAEVRRRPEVPLVEVMVPQPHVLGEECEVDFGSISVYLGGLLTEVSLFVMRLSTVAEHFALEADALRTLPGERFDITVIGSHRVDRQSRVMVRGCHYSVPARLVGRRVDVRVGAETIEVLDGAAVAARHARGLKGDEVLILDHYLEVLAIKPGALLGATALARARAGGTFGPAHERLWSEARRRLGDRDGTRALIDALLLHRALPAEAVAAGIERALTAGSIDAEVIAIEARRANEARVAPVIPIGEGLSRSTGPCPPPITTTSSWRPDDQDVRHRRSRRHRRRHPGAAPPRRPR